MAITTRAGASGLSRAMYSASISRFRRAAFSHLTRILCPLVHDFPNFAVVGKISAVRFLQRLANLFDLPLVDGHIFPYGFRGEKRPAAARGPRQFHQFLFEGAIQAESYDFGIHSIQ